MRVITTELKKLFGNKIFLLIIVAVMILNAYLMFRTANSGESSPADYKAVFSELSDMSDTEKIDWIDKQLNNFSEDQLYNRNVLSELYEECSNIVGYKDYLENIKSQAKSMKSISIFAKPDTFNYRSITITPSAYENVQDVQPAFDISNGIILATDNSFTDVLCVFIVIFIVLTVIISDREQGMSGLLFALKRGRSYLLLMKIATAAVTILGVILLIYTENLIISEQLYGLGNLFRPIQSINGFIGCNLKISVAGYLIIYILFKFISIFAIGSVLSLIAVNAKNTVTFYGISAIIFIIESILYIKIHPLSIYSIFRYINLISFTKTNNIFCNFKNINFWNYPVALIPVSIIAVLSIAAICVGLSAILYSKKRNLEFHKIGLKINIKKNNKIHSKLYYTFYKSLIMQRGFIVVIAFIAISGFMNQDFIKKYDVTDVYYEYYADTLKGKITQDKLDFIDNESLWFDDIQIKIDNFNQTGYSSEKNELYKALAPSYGFKLIKNRIDEIKDIDGVQIFYDTGYRRMFGITDDDDDMKYAFAAVLLCIFLISPLAANDKRYRMSSIINSTSSGKNRYIIRNVTVASAYGLFAAFLWIIPYIITIFQYYGSDGLKASIRSIAFFKYFIIDMTVLQYLILINLLRIVFFIFLSLIMLLVSMKCKNAASAILINFAVFALPVLIYLLGAEFIINIGFNPLLSVNVILNDFKPLQLVVFPITFAFIFISKIKNHLLCS